MRQKLLVIAIIPLMTACQTEGRDVVGPCVHKYIGPVLTLEEARLSGRPIHQIEILSIRAGAHDFDIAAEPTFSDSAGLEVGPGGHVTCTLPCGFGQLPGRWRVSVAGPGGSKGAVDTYARYENGGGNCPSYSSDGSRVVVTLTKAPASAS